LKANAKNFPKKRHKGFKLKKVVFCLLFFTSVLFSATCNISEENSFITIERYNNNFGEDEYFFHFDELVFIRKSPSSIEFYLIGTGGGSGYTNKITCDFTDIEKRNEVYSSLKEKYKRYK